MKNETLYLICLKFFETLHPNFCIDKNELNKSDKLSEDPEDSEDTEFLTDQPPSIDEIIRDTENSYIETNDIDEENISLVTTIENSIESKTNELPSEPPIEPNKDKSDLCSCIKKFGLCFGSKIKKSD